MPSNTSSTQVDLDFDSLKNSLKNFLRSQSQFKDYDYDGSNLSVLLDLLAYNTHKNAFYLNMAISEGFLDSAVLRDSVSSIAKELNYLPRSRRSTKAQVRVNFTATGENQPYTISKGSSFSCQVKNANYIFSIPETIVVSSQNTSFTFDTDVYEGVYIKDAYIMQSGIELQRFRISNKEVDTTSVNVTVYEDGSSEGTRYSAATTLLGLNESSKVFFIQSAENGYYEILFGDNVIGRKPKDGSTIVIDYRVSLGAAPNGARDFTINFNPAENNGLSDLTTIDNVITLSTGVDGRAEESIESIRYYAPRHFQVQERCVVPFDYEIALKTQFPEINAVSVYGGEEVNPPQFGRVFIAVDISDVDGFPESKKRQYYDFIKSRNSLTVTPVFVDPDFTYVDITSKVKYNINITDSSFERIKTLVTDAITTYNEVELDDFKTTLRLSQLVADIDDSDTSIVSNETDIRLYKKVTPLLGRAQNLDINFEQEISDDFPKPTRHPINDRIAVTSSAFTYAGTRCFLGDDGAGIMRIMKADGDNLVKVTNIGTVDYTTGLVKLVSFEIDSYEQDFLKVFVLPVERDVASDKNTILTIEPEGIHLTIEALRL
jgi:hypothetical protein